MESGIRKAAGLLMIRIVKGPTVEYLFLQASHGSHHWTPPKGHVNEGESLLTTALRETKEETCIKENQLKILDIPPIKCCYMVKSKPKEVTYFLAELINPNHAIILSDEHQALKWCDFEASLKLTQYEEMKNVLKNAKDAIYKLFTNLKH